MEVRKPQAPRDTGDVAETTHTRHCPTVGGEPGSLITHVIAPSICMKRQRELYHKCHRCDYRGKAADFVSVAPQANGRSKADNAARQNGAVPAATPIVRGERNGHSK